MTRTSFLAAAALVAAAIQPAAAQSGTHPLVGQWRVQCAGPFVTDGQQAPATTEALLTITQHGDQLVATLKTPSARTAAEATTHKLRGVVVGDSAQFTYTVPVRVDAGHRRTLRESEVRWVIAVHGDALEGSQLRVLRKTAEVLAPTPISGTRVGS